MVQLTVITFRAWLKYTVMILGLYKVLHIEACCHQIIVLVLRITEFPANSQLFMRVTQHRAATYAAVIVKRYGVAKRSKWQLMQT